jgi:hypothetical protein
MLVSFDVRGACPMSDRKQYRTGHAIVRRAETPWLQRPNGRWSLHLDVSMDQGVYGWVVVGKGEVELDAVRDAVRDAIVEAVPPYDQENRP